MLAFLSEPQWSPDGQRLLYTRTAVRAGTFEPSLYVLDVATGKSTKLAGASGSGAWSPDGQRIAFSSVRDRNGRTCGDDCTLHGELYVMNADGTGQTRLTRQKGDDAQPTWAPDGSAIAFSSARNDPDGGGDEVYVIRPDGSCLTWLTNGARDSTDPDWRPGSGALPEGFACGAVPREPTLLRAPRGPGLWLGLTGLRNTLLNEADDGFLSYGDCAVFDPAECGEPIDVQTGSICRGNPLVGGAEVAGTYEIRRGALVERGSDTTVYAGSTYTQIYAARDVDTVIDALRPLPSTEPVPSLEAPRFSARVVARIERARRLGTVRRIAHRLHVSGARARQLLALARATEPFRPLQTTNC